ncbi:MAG: hypothetical protein DDT34_02236 [Firmicutes bacterium]|nr:hypothetical protein [Bacillota bacterium]
MKMYAVILGLLLTPIAVTSATNARGYNAIGGEYLLAPLFLLIAQIIEEVRR